jgi:uncharacterized Zn finger protein (UPF0148 family)
MKCFRCNEQETDMGQLFCGVCQEAHRQQEAETHKQELARHERWKHSTFTWLYFCGTCKTEVYRRTHISHRRNKRREQEIEQQARLALFRHVQKSQHRARLSGPVKINDLSGDDEYEVPATGLPEDRCPRNAQASSVMRVLGSL